MIDSQTPLELSEVIKELQVVANEFRNPGYVSSNMVFVERLDPIIDKLNLILLSQQDGPELWNLQRIEAALKADDPNITIDDGLWLLERVVLKERTEK